MKAGPLVSVIIPTYNRATIIGPTIENVLQQTYRNIEVIVVDDGSTDGTHEILGKFQNRIRVITQTNAGPAVARNRGAAAARGEIIAFQDSDDSWRPTKLERQVSLLEKAGKTVPCCLSNVVMRVANGRQVTSFDVSLIRSEHEEGLWLNVLDVLATRFVLFNQAVAIRREIFEKLGGFDEGLKYLEDYDLPMRLALEGPWAFIKDPLVIYGESSSGSFSQKGLKEPLILKECEIEIFERMLARTNQDHKYLNVQKLLARRIQIFRRGVLATKLADRRVYGTTLVADLLSSMNRYQEAIFRRSPSFPRAITSRLSAAA